MLNRQIYTYLYEIIAQLVRASILAFACVPIGQRFEMSCGKKKSF